INGGNGEHAMLCQWMSPFRNGGNGRGAMSCLFLSPFRNGGNGARVRRCQAGTPIPGGEQEYVAGPEPGGAGVENEARGRSEAVAQLLGLVRSGAYPWVAARAAGLTDAEFRERMAETAADGGSLRAEVQQAQAQARALAEIELKGKNPVAWLRYG